MTEVQVSPEVSEYTEVHRHAEPKSFIWKYIFSVDHKVIGIQYILLALVAVFVGMALSLLVRLRLVWPDTPIPLLGTLFPVGAPEGVMTPEFYLAMLTMHGTVMVFMVLTTAPQGGFGNYFLPIQIGAADMAFPRLNMLSFWTTFVSFLLLMAAFFVEGGAPLSGWPGSPPLRALAAWTASRWVTPPNWVGRYRANRQSWSAWNWRRRCCARPEPRCQQLLLTSPIRMKCFQRCPLWEPRQTTEPCASGASLI